MKGENVQRQNMKADDNQDGRGRAKSQRGRRRRRMLEMAAGYSPGRVRAGECQGQAARQTVGSGLPCCISGN